MKRSDQLFPPPLVAKAESRNVVVKNAVAQLLLQFSKLEVQSDFTARYISVKKIYIKEYDLHYLTG